MFEEFDPAVNEPFGVGRAATRLLFDFAVMLSVLGDHENNRVLDFGCGSGWISEFLCRSGFDVTGVDIDANAEQIFAKRQQADKRIIPSHIRFRRADGHCLPFNDGTFGYLVCFDSLHHMADYRKVFAEMFRVLDQRGRAVFVEPGAKHSSSSETREFVEKYKKDDPDWLEKDVILEEILALAKEVGFQDAKILPHLLPSMKSYEMEEWIQFAKQQRMGAVLGIDYLGLLANLNYNGRVIFYLQK